MGRFIGIFDELRHRKGIKGLTPKQVREFYKNLFRGLWGISEEGKRVCFDCGKLLTPDNIILMCDRHGFLQFCEECTWHRIRVKETWKGVFKNGT